MQFKFMAIVLTGLIFSTGISALESSENPSTSFPTNSAQTPYQEGLASRELLQILGQVNAHNTIFDNYHTGTTVSFEPLEIKKVK